MFWTLGPSAGTPSSRPSPSSCLNPEPVAHVMLGPHCLTSAAPNLLAHGMCMQYLCLPAFSKANSGSRFSLEGCTDWRAATEVCKQPCGLGSSSAFLSRRSGPPVPASCLEMLTKWNQMKPALLLLLAFSISLGIHRNVLTQLELSSSYFVLRKPTSRFFAAFYDP